jgi:glutaminyl-tRNA synthetase
VSEQTENISANFIEAQINSDIAAGLDHIVTRFPPEPNGYLHIGHAKSIFLNFGLAKKYQGKCFLRFDDTNPVKEGEEFVNSIERDVRWLVGDQAFDKANFASDYFEYFYQAAVMLIKKGLAYVDDSTADQIRLMRGTLKSPGQESPFRTRSVEENLQLFIDMRAGKFANGEKVLRAKIDMASPNINMRDPVIYRIVHTSHQRTGDAWCIYPMYDLAHPLEDAIEGVTHSVCTLEFEDHRPLYDWVLDNVKEAPFIKFRSRQYEFARLELENTVTSKRKLKALVEAGLVDGWDDPRLPTLSGLRRRGYTPEALEDFCTRIGVAKTNSRVETEYLKHCLREDLNQHAPRTMAVLDPLKVTITNYPEGQIEMRQAPIYPQDENSPTVQIPFGRHLYIEREDFREQANNKFYRLKPGKEVRLKSAYIIKCEDYIKDEATGEIKELLCTYDPDSATGGATANRKIKGTLHWVEATQAVEGEVHLLGDLLDFSSQAEDIVDQFNPESLRVLDHVKFDPSMADAPLGQTYQFQRKGYFCVDSKYSKPDRPVFVETVSLKDSFKG